MLWLGALLATSGLPRAANGQDLAQVLEQYLRGVHLDPGQLDAAARGTTVVKPLVTGDDRDVAVFGMTRVSVSQDSVLSYLLDRERPLGAGDGRRTGIFGDPPRPADLARISLDDSEYRELRDCRPGNCRFKLPAVAMRAFALDIDWSAPDAKVQADRRMRAALIQLVREYRDRGDRATLAYDDRNRVRSSDVFADLAARTARWLEYPAELRRFFETYPSGRPAGVRDILCWEEARARRLRPTLSVNHVVAYPEAPGSAAAFVVSKQLYASHYLDGAIELIEVLDLGTRAEWGTFLLVIRYTRFDQLSRGVLNLRGRVEEQSLEVLRSDLEQQRRVLSGHESP